MAIRTIEDNFEYQINETFKEMLDDYKQEQNTRKVDGDIVETFAEWLWMKREWFGEIVYNKFDDYTNIDESTEKFNF